MAHKKILTAIILLCILGLVFSSYLAYLHYKPEKLEGSFCEIGEYLSCSSVNKSKYSVFLGIPVALIGIVGLLVLAGIALKKPKYYGELLFFLSLGALVFMLYLLYAELFIIRALCLYCMFTLATVAAIFILSAYTWGKEGIQLLKKIW